MLILHDNAYSAEKLVELVWISVTSAAETDMINTRWCFSETQMIHRLLLDYNREEPPMLGASVITPESLVYCFT